MYDFIARLFPQKFRAWLYRVLTVAVPLLVVHGVLEDTDASLWVALAAAVLGTGTATLNTSTKEPS